MSTRNVWRGDRLATADVWTLTVTGPATGNGTVTIPIGNKSVVVAYTNTQTAAVIAAAIQAALSNSAIPEVRELVWQYPGIGGVVTGTGAAAGVPVTVGAPVVTGGTGVAVAQANTVAATGPNFANDPLNWSLGHLPTAGEFAWVDSGPSLLYGLAGMYGGTVDGTYINAAMTEHVGLPVRNTSGSLQYVEYRQRYLDCSANGGDIHIGRGDGSGSPLVRIRIGDLQKVYVYATAQTAEDGTPAVDLQTTGSGNPAEVNVYGGSVGYGVSLPATRALTLGSVTGQGVLVLNFDCTTLNQFNGSVVNYAHLTNHNIHNGDYTQQDGRIDTIVADGGIVRLNHDQGANQIFATFRASQSGNPPYLDATGTSKAGKVLTNTSTFRAGAYILNPFKTVTLTGVTFDKQSLNASDIGDTFAITVV